VSAEIFFGRGQKEHQDREIAPISLLPFYLWGLEGALGMHPELTSKGVGRKFFRGEGAKGKKKSKK